MLLWIRLVTGTLGDSYLQRESDWLREWDSWQPEYEAKNHIVPGDEIFIGIIHSTFHRLELLIEGDVSHLASPPSTFTHSSPCVPCLATWRCVCVCVYMCVYRTTLAAPSGWFLLYCSWGISTKLRKTLMTCDTLQKSKHITETTAMG